MGRVGAVRPTAGVAAIAVVVAAVAALTLAADTAGPARLTFLQFNLCGNACNNGAFGVVGELVAAVGSRRPFAVTLNEVCEHQYARLRAGLPAYRGHFDPTGARCRGGGRYGNAVLVRGAEFALVGGWDLPNSSGDEARRLACVRTRRADAAPLVVCVTHVSNHAGNIGPQVEAVASRLRALADPVLVAGDLNTDPADPRLDPLYRPGRFREADAGGCADRSRLNRRVGPDVVNEDTYQRHKYDYIFVSDGPWSTVTADATDPNGFSDHDLLWATATLR